MSVWKRLQDHLFGSYYGDTRLLDPDSGQWGTIQSLPPGMTSDQALTLFQRTSGDGCQRVFTVYVSVGGGEGLPVGLLSWGSGALMVAEVDIVKGSLFRVVGQSVGLQAFNEATLLAPIPAPVVASASAGIGMSGGVIAPTRTRRLDAPAGVYTDFPQGVYGFIPPFSRNFVVYLNDKTSAYSIRILDRNALTLYEHDFAAGEIMTVPVILPAGSFKVQINPANACVARCVFGLQL